MKRNKFFKYLLVISIFFSTIFLSSCSSDFLKQSLENENDYPILSEATTLKEDMSNLLQEGIDNLDEEIGFIVTGEDSVALILELDENGEYSGTSAITDLLTTNLEETLMDMDGFNINPYARTILEQYSIDKTLLVGDSILDYVQLEIVYSLDWGSDDVIGEYEAVKSHVNNYLESEDYKSAVKEREKIEKINSYITNTFQYDYRYFSDYPEEDLIYSAYDMITDNKGEDMPINGYPRGVCQAYASYGFVMLQEAGFETITIDGTAGGISHIWNMVKVDGSWYHVDFTWNDPVTFGVSREYTNMQDGAGYSLEDYLLVSDKFMINNSHVWEEVEYNYTYPLAQ